MEERDWNRDSILSERNCHSSDRLRFRMGRRRQGLRTLHQCRSYFLDLAFVFAFSGCFFGTEFSSPGLNALTNAFLRTLTTVSQIPAFGSSKSPLIGIFAATRSFFGFSRISAP